MSRNSAVACAGRRDKTMFIMMMFLMSVEGQGMGTCPVTSNITVSLTSSFDQDGRSFACPGERVMFFCEVNRSTSVQIAAEPFICLADPVVYLATDPVGRTRPIGSNPFQANLTDVQREPGTLIAYYNTTLTTIVASGTDNTTTTVECSNQLTLSSSVQRRKLSQSQIPTPPPGLSHRLMSRDCFCHDPESGSINITCTCQTADLLLFWEAASGMFDVDCYVVTVFPVNTPPTVSPTLDFPACISPGISYSVHVWTVSRCGELSSSPAVQRDVRVDEHLATVTLPGPVTIIAPALTLSNIVVIGIGGALLSLATVVSLCRLCFIDLQERLFKGLIAVERLLRGISLLLVVVTVFLLNINEPCNETCQRTNNVTTSLFLVSAIISATLTLIITGVKIYKYRKFKGFRHLPRYIRLQEDSGELRTRTRTDSGSRHFLRTPKIHAMPKHGIASDEETRGLYRLKIEQTTDGQMLLVVHVEAKKKDQGEGTDQGEGIDQGVETDEDTETDQSGDHEL